MRELEKPIGRVWRRLRLQRFLTTLVWCWGVGLALAAATVASAKLGYPVPGPEWLPFAAAGGAGLLVALVLALVSGPSRVDAAVAIDRVFGLNDRLGTSLTLPEDLRETPAGRALLADTLRHVRDLDVLSRFRLRLPPRAWVPLVPAALAVALGFLPEWTQQSARAKAAAALDPKAVAEQTKALSKKIAAKREELDKAKFAEADKILAEIQKGVDDLAKAPPAEKNKAMVELNKLTDAVKERQKQLGSPEQINRQLQQLKDMASQGPADDFNKALSKGDFQKAAEQMKQLSEKLASGKMSEAEKKALKEQIQQTKEQLQKLANMEERKKQLEEARKNGGLSQEQFDREMAKLEEQSKSLQKLQQMAQQLAQAEQAMREGDMQKAAQAMGMTQQQLEQMAQQAQELEALDGALAEIMDAKNAMSGDSLNQFGDSFADAFGRGNGREGRGNGLGQGRGEGDRPEAKDDVATTKTQVKPKIGKGKAVLEGFAPPTGMTKGESLIDIQGEIESAPGVAAEALTNQRVPQSIEKHVRGYFDRINNQRP